MKSIELPDGHSAIVREMSDLKRGDVRKIFRLLDQQGVKLDELNAEGTLALVDSAITVLVDSWDLTTPSGDPLPVSPESVDELSLDIYPVLAGALQATVVKILNMGSAPDPKSEPSSSQPVSTD